MGLFGNSSSVFDQPLDKATDECNTEEDWSLIMSICDKVKTTTDGPKEFCKAIHRRITHRNPHVALKALTVLDSCVNNCGIDFKKEVASQEFISQLRGVMSNPPHPKVGEHLKMLIRQWAEDFKDDPQLSRLTSFYHFMRSEGYEFPTPQELNPKKSTTAAVSKDPNVVSSQQEADDIAKAIEMSLKEDNQKKSISSSVAGTSKSTGSSNLYPTMLGGSSSTSSNQSISYTSGSANLAKRTVKALYDFEAAEDNELTFKAGDLISILDDSDANWWKGQNGSDTGLFPANFVTDDLAVEPEPDFGVGKSEDDEEKAVSFNEEVEVKEVDLTEPVLEIDEELMDKTLLELQNTDPESDQPDSQELLTEEESCTQMGPLIDQKLEEIDRKHLEYTQLNEKILEALNMYDKLMNEMPAYNPLAPPSYLKQHMSMPAMNPYAPQGMSGPPASYSAIYTQPQQMQQAGAAVATSANPQLPGAMAGGYSPYQQNMTQGQPTYAMSNGMPPQATNQHFPVMASQQPPQGSDQENDVKNYPQQVYSDSTVGNMHSNQAMYSNQPTAAPPQQYAPANYSQPGQVPATGQQYNTVPSMQPLM